MMSIMCFNRFNYLFNLKIYILLVTTGKENQKISGNLFIY